MEFWFFSFSNNSQLQQAQQQSVVELVHQANWPVHAQVPEAVTWNNVKLQPQQQPVIAPPAQAPAVCGVSTQTIHQATKLDQFQF